MARPLFRFSILIILATVVRMDNVTATSNSTEPTLKPPTSETVTTVTTATPLLTTSLSPEELCGQKSSSCDACVGVSGAKCLWCSSDGSCKPYPYNKILPTDICDLSKARWGVCWINFEALIITVSVIGGVIVLTVTCICIYCCCCRGNNQKKYEKEEARATAQRMERKARSDERRAERQTRLDEIRRKYGLMKDDAPYQRFDA